MDNSQEPRNTQAGSESTGWNQPRSAAQTPQGFRYDALVAAHARAAALGRTDFTDDAIDPQYVVIHEGKVERHTGTCNDLQHPRMSSRTTIDSTEPRQAHTRGVCPIRETSLSYTGTT